MQALAACLILAMAMILVKEISELSPELHTLLRCSLHLLWQEGGSSLAEKLEGTIWLLTAASNAR